MAPSGERNSCTIVRMNRGFSIAIRRKSVTSARVTMRPRASPSSPWKVATLASTMRSSRGSSACRRRSPGSAESSATMGRKAGAARACSTGMRKSSGAGLPSRAAIA